MTRRRKRNRGSAASGGTPTSPAAQRTRTEVAQVAARLMAEEGVHGFGEAKARALDQLRVSGRQATPRNDEIEAEIRAYQALFQADEQPVWLARMRRTALEVMDLLAPFNPRLVGSVLRGTAPRDAEITLHLFTEPPEAVATWLYDRAIPWDLDSWVGRFGGDRERELPVYRIAVAGQPVRLIVFSPQGGREAPRSPVDGRPMARAGRGEVVELLAGDGAPSDDAAGD